MGPIISAADRIYIENKYHKTSEPFDPFNRFPYHGYEYDAATGLDDAEMATGLEALYAETVGDTHALAKAKGFAFVLDHMRIDVSEHDYFTGFYNWARPLHKTFIQKWYQAAFGRIPEIQQKMRDYMSTGTADMWLDMDHVVPNWIDLLKLGFPGILERVQNYRKKHLEFGTLDENGLSFLSAIELEYSAIIRLIRRFRDYALAHPCEKTPLVADSLERLAVGCPQTTLDALELMYIYFMCSESVDQYQARSIGNGLDRSLWAFYSQDIANGTFTKEQICSFLTYFLLQFAAIGNYWGEPFYLCGTDFDNKTDISELSVMILDVFSGLGLYNPKIQIKLDDSTPAALPNHVLELIRAGHTSFVFCCVPGMMKSLMACYGVTAEEARNCDISGCNEMHIRANEACMISSLPNAAKALTFLFHNGVDYRTGKRMGLETGDLASLMTYEDFYAAFLKQFAHMLDEIIGMARVYEPLVAEISPSILLSGAMENSLKTGKDAYAFGVKYPTSALLLCSFATTVDSLLAIKELVYDRQVVTLETYKAALDANWEGYEDLQNMAKNAKHKYGNGDKEADLVAAALYRWFAVYVTGQKNGRGGVYKVGVPSTLHFISQGKQTEATPDGRRMGEECSKNVAPVVGMERQGVMGMLHSAMALSPWLFSEAFVLDVMLHPSAVAGDEGMNALRSLLMTYMKQDGISIQFNIFSAEMLRDAQQHPDKYKNLEVRVSGWNVLWNSLRKEEQDAYILRAESLRS